VVAIGDGHEESTGAVGVRVEEERGGGRGEGGR